MAIEFEVTDISTIDEEIRGAYVEKDGKHVFDPEKYHEMKAAPLIAKNRELIGDKKKLAEEKKALEKIKGTAETDVEKVAQEKDRTIAELRTELRESKIWTPVQQLAVKHGVMPDRIESVMTILRSQGRFDQDDAGKLIFKDKYGDETAIKPERAFEYYLKEELPWAFDAPKTGGSGAKNGTKAGAGRVLTRERFDTMSQAERDKVISEGTRIVD